MPRLVRSALRDQEGLAMPLAMMVLVLLTSLIVAFVTMTATEPLIAANLKSGDIALRLAEAGVERGLWALDNPAAPASGITNPAGPPYNGSQILAFGRGGYTISVTSPAAGWACATASIGPVARCVQSTGFVLRDGAPVPAAPPVPAADQAARRMVEVALTKLVPDELPSPFNVAGTTQLQGNSIVNGAAPKNCPVGTTKYGVTYTEGNTVTTGGSAEILGLPEKIQEVTQKEFDQFTFDKLQLEALKQLAIAGQNEGKPNFRYIKPTSNDEFELNMTDGLIFVDLVNAKTLPDDLKTDINPGDIPVVKITGANNKGWLIVLGSIRMDGNIKYDGLMYALNDITYRGTGAGEINGAVISRNVIDTVSTLVDTETLGNAVVTYDCQAIAGDGFIPQGYSPIPGSWREVTN